MKFTAHALPGPLKADGSRWIGVVRNEAGKIVRTHYHAQHTAGDALAWAHQIIDGLKKGRVFVS